MQKIKKLSQTAILTSLCLFLTSTPMLAQTYPNKPVKVVVPFPAGGIVDILARSVTEKIASNWDHPSS
jgi:tripartite-type tricarboxylate transporter receptor subunit TctC